MSHKIRNLQLIQAQTVDWGIFMDHRDAAQGFCLFPGLRAQPGQVQPPVVGVPVSPTATVQCPFLPLALVGSKRSRSKARPLVNL